MADDTTTQTSTPRGTSLLETLGINADEVLAGSNVEQTIQSPVAPTNDALGIFAQQDTLAGVADLQAKYTDAQKNYLDAQNLAKQEQVTLQGRRKKLGVMRGEQAQAAQQAQVDLGTLQSGMSLAESALQSAQATSLQKANILYSEYQTKNNLLLQFPGLDIDPLNDSIENVSEKLKDYKEEEEKDAYKKSLKAELRSLGLKTKGNTKKLEKRLRKYNKSALSDAKRKSDIQTKSLEISLQKAEQSLAQARLAAQPFDPSEYYGSSSQNQSLVADNEAAMSVNPLQSVFS